MLKIHKKTEYALIAIRFIAEKSGDESFTAKDISEGFDLPFDVIARVLQIFAFHGYLQSSQGAKGGYRKSEKDILALNFLDLVEMLEGPQALTKCLEGSDCPINSKCNVISPIEKLNENLKNFFREQKIGELLKEARHV